MEELQSWWEVPTIAHFCYVFRAAFNLFHCEIEELEEALLQINETEHCASVEQLVMRLLQGCCKPKVVTIDNWEEQLWELLKTGGSKTDAINSSTDASMPFVFLPLRTKVDILLSLCELRLNAEDVIEAIKNLEGDNMRIEPLGTDSENNVYWYFFGVRLYKEDRKKIKDELKKRKKEAPLHNFKQKKKEENTKHGKGSDGAKPNSENGRRKSSREARTITKSKQTSAWSIICYSIEDWEAFSKILRKSKAAADKKLSNLIEEKYLPLISNVVVERERIMRKRLIDLAPRRASARIHKVRRQREEECVILEQARLKKIDAEKRRQAIEESKRREREIEERGKRAAERHKCIEERAKRARQREVRLYDSEGSDSQGSGFSSRPVSTNGIGEESSSSEEESASSSSESDNESGEDEISNENEVNASGESDSEAASGEKKSDSDEDDSEESSQEENEDAKKENGSISPESDSEMPERNKGTIKQNTHILHIAKVNDDTSNSRSFRPIDPASYLNRAHSKGLKNFDSRKNSGILRTVAVPCKKLLYYENDISAESVIGKKLQKNFYLAQRTNSPTVIKFDLLNG